MHDLYIHGRFVRLPVWRPFEYLREAHALHHRFGAEPYGMLCPIVPKALRQRARPGWDAFTGPGSPDGTRLLAGLRAAAPAPPAPPAG